MSNVDSSWLYEPLETPAPQPAYQVPSPASMPPRRDWLMWGVVAGLLCVIWFMSRSGKTPDVKPNFDVDSVHVLILEESADRDRLTKEQLAVFNSVPLRQLVNDELKGSMRVIDVDDINQLAAPWRGMAETATARKPAVVVATPRTSRQFTVQDVDATIATIKSVVGGQ